MIMIRIINMDLSASPSTTSSVSWETALYDGLFIPVQIMSSSGMFFPGEG